MTTTEVPTPESLEASPLQTLAMRLSKLDTRASVNAGIVVVFLAFCLALPSILIATTSSRSRRSSSTRSWRSGSACSSAASAWSRSGQAAVLAIGAWVGARRAVRHLAAVSDRAPDAGPVTMVLGTLVGLPALRMRGLYLALITLMLAGAITVVLATTNFPNGGHGFLGYNGNSIQTPPIRRPASPPPIRRSCATRS